MQLFLLYSLYEAIRIFSAEVFDVAWSVAVLLFVVSSPLDLSKIVADDLRNSGKFNPIAVSQMPHHLISAAEVNPEAWSNVGIDAIVIGQVIASGTGYSITYQLFVRLVHRFARFCISAI